MFSDETFVTAAMCVFFLICIIFIYFIFNLLYSKNNNKSTEQTNEEHDESSFILKEIKNASQNQLKPIIEKGYYLLPKNFKPAIDVAYHDRLIKLELKPKRDNFENRENSVRKQWLITCIFFHLWVLLGSHVLNEGFFPVKLFGLLNAYILYNGYVRKSTSVGMWGIVKLIYMFNFVSFLWNFETNMLTVQNYLFLGIAFICFTVFSWYCYQLYKINYEFKGREYLKTACNES